jgi:asparagine synthetase B (glutamine-hydrolysing)
LKPASRCWIIHGFEHAARIPDALKTRDGKTKWPLREILRKHVPLELFERPKMGFSPPTGRWLRGPLRDWAEAQLGEERLRRENLFLTPTGCAGFGPSTCGVNGIARPRSGTF